MDIVNQIKGWEEDWRKNVESLFFVQSFLPGKDDPYGDLITVQFGAASYVVPQDELRS